MKNNQLFLTIILAFFGLGAQTLIHAAEMKQQEGAAPAAQTLPIMLPDGTVEQLQLDMQEFFTHKTFAQLIDAQKAKGRSFILARVVTKERSWLVLTKKSVNYFDAHAFNKYLLTQLNNFVLAGLISADYPIDITDQNRYRYSIDMPITSATKQFYNAAAFQEGYVKIKDPLNNKVIASNEDIQYFQLINNQFIPLLSNKDLFLDPNAQAREFNLNGFYANQSSDLPLQAQAHYKLGEIYYYGNQTVPKNYPQALAQFELALQSNANPQARAKAYYMAGIMYYKGEGVVQDYQQALQYLMPAAKQNADWWTKTRALKAIALIKVTAPWRWLNAELLKIMLAEPVEEEVKVVRTYPIPEDID